MNQEKKLRRAIYVKICLLRKVTKSSEKVTKSLRKSYEERRKSCEDNEKVTKRPTAGSWLQTKKLPRLFVTFLPLFVTFLSFFFFYICFGHLFGTSVLVFVTFLKLFVTFFKVFVSGPGPAPGQPVPGCLRDCFRLRLGSLPPPRANPSLLKLRLISRWFGETWNHHFHKTS